MSSNSTAAGATGSSSTASGGTVGSTTNGTKQQSTGRSSSEKKDTVQQSAATTTTSSLITTTTTSTKSLKDSIFGAIRSSTNGANTSSASANRSPTSPSRITRLHEKEEMQNLNDRLVVYIDTVRRLEQENTRLQSIVYSYNENSTRDVCEIKSLYERELEDAKRLIDELAREKAKFEILLNKANSEAEEATSKLAKRDKDIKSLQDRLRESESESLEYKSRYEAINADNARKQEELDKLRPAFAESEKSLAKTRKLLEAETLVRVDLENKNQTLREDLTFKSQIYDKEVDQMRSSKRVEIEQVDVRLRDEYDSRLMSELQRIRDETESKISEMKDEVERRFHNKLIDSDSNLKRLQQSNSAVKDELASSRQRIEDLQSELKQQQQRLQNSDIRGRDLEEKIRKLNMKYEKDIGEKDVELNSLRKELHDLLLEYQELYDIKINLDMEIAAYRKLLESEEQRLNISTVSHHHNHHNQQSLLGSSYLGDPTSSSQSAASSGATNTRSAKKRKATTNINENQDLILLENDQQSFSYNQKHQSSCGVEIGEHDFEGKFVKLINKSDKDVSLGGWILRRSDLNNEHTPVEFKFSKNFVLKAGNQSTVWSSGLKADATNDFVLAGQASWFVCDHMLTSLVDKDSNEQSSRESKKIQSSVSEKKIRATPNRSSTVSTTISTTELRVTREAAADSTNGTGSSSGVSKLFNFFNR